MVTALTQQNDAVRLAPTADPVKHAAAMFNRAQFREFGN
jgi:hypothetical protein